MQLSTTQLGYVAMALFGLGVGGTLYCAVTDQNGPLIRRWRQYVRSLEKELNALALTTPPYEIVAYEVAGAVFLVFLGYALEMWIIAAAALLVPLFTLIGFRLQRISRLEQITLQLDGWLLMLANMLEATGSVGQAIRSSADLTQKPLRDEIEILIKRVDVGTPLTQALDQMYERIPAPGLRAVIASLRIGGRTGGELPQLLKENAAVLREAERIDKFIKSKVAEGRTQVIALALSPFAFIYMLKEMEPTFFDPMINHYLGPVIITCLIFLWVGSVWMALKIIQVDV